MLNGRWRGQDLGACTDCRRYWTEYRAGTIGDVELGELEEALFRSHGHCMVMGTASTMAAATEGLGMTLPGGRRSSGDAKRIGSRRSPGGGSWRWWRRTCGRRGS
jgi:dihydroxyacid dehydratase/phosphogluconate dehydratase